MAEAFIMGGGGGGATIQHITATNATSTTFTLTNPKRKNCLVFGRIYCTKSERYDYSPFNMKSSYKRDHILYGTKYSVLQQTTYPSNTADSFSSELGISFTRNANSITITLNSSHPYTYAYQTSWDVNTDTTYVVLNRTNTIDIYVVDYD